MPKKPPRLLNVTADDNDGGFPSNFRFHYQRESGSGSIIIVKRGPYEYHRARFWVTDELGVRRVRYVYCKSYTEAELKMAAALRMPSEEMGATTTVAVFMRDWLGRVKAENRIGTYRLYESTFRNHVEPHVGKVKFRKLTAANVRALLTKLSEISVGDRTRQNVRKVLHAAYEVALRDGVIPRNPVALVRAPKAEHREQHILSQDEADRLLDVAAGTHWYGLISLALNSGMRQGELFALTVGDLRLDDEHPHLFGRRHAHRGRGWRTGPYCTEDEVEPSARGPRRGYGRTAPRSDRWASRERVRVHQAVRIGCCERACFSVGCSIRWSSWLGCLTSRFTSLRHVPNTLLLANGAASHLDLAARLGHSTPRMTLERYARVLPGAQAELAVKAAALFGRGAKRVIGANGGATDSRKPPSQ